MRAPARRWLAVFAAVQLVIAVAIGFTLQSELGGQSERASTIWWWLMLTWAGSVGVTSMALIWAERSLADALQSLVATVHAGGARVRSGSAGDSVFDGIAGSVQRMAQELDVAMHSLATERNRFEAVLETMAPGVLALDATRHITSANRSARSLFEITSSCEQAALVDVLRVPSLHAFVDGVFAGGPSELEIELPAAGRHIRARASRLGDGGIVIVADDTTEIRRLERVRQDFVANVSHELRTPIAVIRANAETLLDGALESPKTAEVFVTALFRHADRLGRLVAELLDISALEAGKRVLAVEQFELAEVIEDVIAAQVPAATERGMTLRSVAHADVWVRGDWKATEQILVNFIDNAIKYGRQGGTVEVAAFERDGMIRIEVRDDGSGIEPQHRARIFERFYRIDSGRSRDAGGTGLGLSIAKHLADAMGGAIGMDARSPRGSVFWFTLSATPAPET